MRQFHRVIVAVPFLTNSETSSVLAFSKIIGPGSEGLGLFVPIKDALEALNVKIAGVSSQS